MSSRGSGVPRSRADRARYMRLARERAMQDLIEAQIEAVNGSRKRKVSNEDEQDASAAAPAPVDAPRASIPAEQGAAPKAAEEEEFSAALPQEEEFSVALPEQEEFSVALPAGAYLLKDGVLSEPKKVKCQQLSCPYRPVYKIGDGFSCIDCLIGEEIVTGDCIKCGYQYDSLRFGLCEHRCFKNAKREGIIWAADESLDVLTRDFVTMIDAGDVKSPKIYFGDNAFCFPGAAFGFSFRSNGRPKPAKEDEDDSDDVFVVHVVSATEFQLFHHVDDSCHVQVATELNQLVLDAWVRHQVDFKSLMANVTMFLKYFEVKFNHSCSRSASRD